MKEVAGYILEPKIMANGSESSLHTLAAAFAIVFAIGLFALHLFKFPMDATILDTQYQVESSRAQTIFYQTLLGLFAVICAAVLWPNAKIIPSVGWADQVLAAVVVIAAIFLGSWSKQFLQGFIVVAAVLTCSRARWFDPISSVWTRSRLVQVQPFTGVFFWLIISIILVYFTLFLIAPLATPLLIHGAGELRAIEGHYAATVLPGFDFICCSEVGTIEHANYGLGMPLLIALALKVLAFFGVSNTALVQAVKLNQLIAVAMICALSFLTNRKYFPYVMALALGMTAFTLSNVGIAVGYPNQSGIRYIPILASLIVLVLEMRRAQLRIWLLASAAAIFVIMSPETGLATTAGYIVATVLKRYTPKTPIASIAGTFMWFGAVFAVTMVAGSVLITGPILKNSSGGLFQFMALFATGGYGGLVDKPSMTATLLFFVATTAVLRGVWRARDGILLSVDAYEAAVGTIMLVWLMYYVNRMAEWNLWFQLVLLALLIAPRVTLEGWQQLFRKPLRFGVTFSMIIACLIGGQLASSSSQFADLAVGWLRWQRVGCGDGMILDGKCLPWLRGSRSELQMNALTEGHSPSDTLVLAAASTYVRLHGFNEGFPWYDPFFEVVREKDVNTIVKWIEMRGPKYILTDDPNSDIALAAPEYSRQIQSYLTRLVSYREVRRDAGWIMLERVVTQRVELH
jgi:hypothetical protein